MAKKTKNISGGKKLKEQLIEELSKTKKKLKWL